MCVRDQALLYYYLLHSGLEETRRVLQARRLDISLGVFIGHPAEPISQWARSFNTLGPLKEKAIETGSAGKRSPEHVIPDPKLNPDLSDTLSYIHAETGHSDDGDCSGTKSSCAVMASGISAPLSLSLSPLLSPEEFEHMWLQRQLLHDEQGFEEKKEEDCVWVEERLHCKTIHHCSPQSLQATMQLVNIQTLAFTPPHTLPWRIYFYTHAHHGTLQHSLILGELLYTGPASQEKSLLAEAEENEQIEGEESEATAAGDHEGEKSGIKVTLRLQPSNDKCLRGFISVLTTVLDTLSEQTG